MSANATKDQMVTKESARSFLSAKALLQRLCFKHRTSPEASSVKKTPATSDSEFGAESWQNRKERGRRVAGS